MAPVWEERAQGGVAAGAVQLHGGVPRSEVKVLAVCAAVLLYRAKLLGIKNKAFLCHAPSSVSID